MNNNLNRILRVLYVKEQPGVRFRFGTLLLRVNDDRLIPVCTLSEFIGFDIAFYPGSVIGIFAHHQHERFNNMPPVVGGINLQLRLCSFMAGDTIRQHHFVQLLVTEIVEVNIRAGYGIRSSGITILDCSGKRILIHDVFERFLFIAFRDKRRGR